VSRRAALPQVWLSSTVVVAVDVGKMAFAVSVSGADRRRLLGPVECAMTRPALDRLVEQVRAVLPGPDSRVRVGVEAAGHYHQPLVAPAAWPASWQVVELNPAHVTEQRRVMGRRRVKTDAIDLEAITELLLAGRGEPVTDRQQVPGSRYWVNSPPGPRTAPAGSRPAPRRRTSCSGSWIGPSPG
jgi:transposase